MAEYVNAVEQVVQPNQNVLLNGSIECNKGCIYHREGSGLLTLKGTTANSFARYQATFNANIAVPTGGTVGPIAIALAIGGEPLQTSKAIVTPAAVGDYFNVTSTAIITVPKGCGFTLSVENVSEGATAADAPTAISVMNANLVVTRIA